MVCKINKLIMYWSRLSFLLESVMLIIMTGSLVMWLYVPQIDVVSVSGRLTVTVHNLFCGGYKVPDALLIHSGERSHTMWRGQQNKTVVFDDVDYLSGIVFRVMEGPHARVSMMLMIPELTLQKARVYRFDNLNTAVLTINWVKEPKIVIQGRS